ncbi:MAG: AAA family ATPase [Elusimicrobiota bacterium]|nr:MAG: AAA family ATPase [Elusimicrobiota bacterium]
MALFERLYELHGQIEREGERFELILGDGILSWRRPEGGVLHPILLKRIQLQFDADAPEFKFVETGTPTEIYSALFRSMNDVDGKLLGKCREEVEKRGYHPMGAGLTSGFLRKFAQLLNAQGQYADSLPLRIETDHPRISRNPYIFLRSRSLGFTTAIEAILEDIQKRDEFSPSLMNIVGIETRPSVGDIDPEDYVEPTAPMGNEDVDILLSKPANPEQLKLAQRLEQHGSVVVQGPPGTGKTHTIANLLGHLLAQGKSVLVTSHTSKALRVLREKVVESLQPLCVSVLESDLDSRKQLEGSVSKIVERLTSSDTKDLQRRAETLTKARANLLGRSSRRVAISSAPGMANTATSWWQARPSRPAQPHDSLPLARTTTPGFPRRWCSALLSRLAKPNSTSFIEATRQ